MLVHQQQFEDDSSSKAVRLKMLLKNSKCVSIMVLDCDWSDIADEENSSKPGSLKAFSGVSEEIALNKRRERVHKEYLMDYLGLNLKREEEPKKAKRIYDAPNIARLVVRMMRMMI
ncbi:hypothetical protein Tco_0690762 [Tanacetum coccineum]